MFSSLLSLWTVFLHLFRRRVTVQYPEEKPYLPPRFRGRIILSRDPDGEERCVACYLAATYRRGDRGLQGLLYEAATVILTRNSAASTRKWGLALKQRIGV